MDSRGGESHPLLWSAQEGASWQNLAENTVAARIYFDPNAVADGAYFALSFNGAPIEASEIGDAVKDGDAVILFYGDSAEEFELDATLISERKDGETSWRAVPFSPVRRIR